MRKTKTQVRAEQIAKLQSEQDAHDKNVKESMKTAAFSRCAAVEELYELLGIEHEKTSTRESKNGPVQVSTDKDETKRSNRLVEAVARLVAGREESAASLPQLQQTSTVPGTASAVGGQPIGGRPIG